MQTDPVNDIKVPQERLESRWFHMLFNLSHGTLMSSTDRSAQRHFKSNAPIGKMSVSPVSPTTNLCF